MTASPPSDRSLFASLQNVGETLVVSVPTVLDAALGRIDRKECDKRLASWSRRVCAHAAIDLVVEGAEHVEAGRTYLVMSNHESLYDVPVLFAAMERAGGGVGNLRMVTKTELFKIPIFGPAMKNAGFVEINRAHRRKAMRSLDEAREALANGTHIWISPEGTRSKSGALLPFKRGPFQLSIDSRLPLLPIALVGTREVLGKHGMRTVRGQRVVARIAAPIDPAPYAEIPQKRGRDVLSRDVEAILRSNLRSDAPVAAPVDARATS